MVFQEIPKGRAIFAGVTVAIGSVFFDLTILIKGGVWLFLMLRALTGFFVPMAGPAASASLQDISLPEVRSTAFSIQLFFENIGSGFALLITGYLADIMGLEQGIIIIITLTWSACALLLSAASLTIPKDVEWKKTELTARANKLSS